MRFIRFAKARGCVGLSLALAITFSTCAISAPAVAQDSDAAVDVFEAGQGGYHTYRIPAIVETTRGTLLAFCEGRLEGQSDAGNIDLLVKRSTDGGLTWSEASVVWNDGANTCGNPCPVVDRDTGTIWLAMTWNLGTDHERDIMAGTSQQPRLVFMTHSDDDGLTWSEPAEISSTTRREHWRWYATGPGNGIQLTRGEHAGRLVIPANHSDHSDASKHPYRSHVFWSDDHGATWELGGVQEDRTNESAVIELGDGSLMQIMRSYHGTNRRAMATSVDAGATWSSVYLQDELDTPVCQASCVRVAWPTEDKPGLLMFSSPRGRDRSHMTIWSSIDEGESWQVEREVEAGSAAYSNLVRLSDTRVGLLYERDSYRTIRWQTFSVNDELPE